MAETLLNPSGFWKCSRDENATTRKYQVFIPDPSLRKDYKFYVGKLGAVRYGKTIKSSISTDADKFLARYETVPATPPMPTQVKHVIKGLPKNLPPGDHTIQVTDVTVDPRTMTVTQTGRYLSSRPNYEEIERRMSEGIAEAGVADVLKLNADVPDVVKLEATPRTDTGRIIRDNPTLHTIDQQGKACRITSSGKDD